MTSYLINTPVVLPADGIVYRVRKMSPDAAFVALGDGFTSAIGHQGTVDVLKAIFPGLAANIVLNRIEIKEPARQIVFKLKGRLPEGKVLNKDEIEAIGYEFWSVTPVKEKTDTPVSIDGSSPALPCCLGCGQFHDAGPPGGRPCTVLGHAPKQCADTCDPDRCARAK